MFDRGRRPSRRQMLERFLVAADAEPGGWILPATLTTANTEKQPRDHAGAPTGAKAPPSEGGFTLIEVLVAVVVLSVGLLGLATLNFAASSATLTTKAREGATNLAREVVEGVVAQPYSNVNPANLASLMQSQPGLAPTAGYSGWTVVRRSIPYTLSVAACYVDDPVDGLGVHDSTYCSASSSGSDSQPVDYKRISVTASWNVKGVQRSVTQTTLLATKGTKDAPAVTSL